MRVCEFMEWYGCVGVWFWVMWMMWVVCLRRCVYGFVDMWVVYGYVNSGCLWVVVRVCGFMVWVGLWVVGFVGFKGVSLWVYGLCGFMGCDGGAGM